MQMSGTPKVCAIAPVKKLSLAKRRLSAILLPHERVKLARTMLNDVLTALRAAPGVECIVAVSADPMVAKIAQMYDVQAIGGAVDCGLNAAVLTGLKAIGRRSCGVLIVPADVPFAAPAELQAVIAGLTDQPIVLTPATSDGGTNALAMRTPDSMAPCFGKDSFERHWACARAAGLGVSAVRAAGLGHDIDRPRDLIFSADLGGATQTAALLTELNVRARLSASRISERLG